MSSTLVHGFLYGANLPLRWFRLPLLLATVGLSGVCIAVGIQAIRGANHLEKLLSELASQDNVVIKYDMHDIRILSDILTAVAILLAVSALSFALMLSVDWIKSLRRPSTTPTSMKEKMPSIVVPVSTRSLHLQSIILAFLSIWLLALLIPTTIIVRTKSAHVSVFLDSPMESVTPSQLMPDPIYWDYPFLRCLAAAPWFSFIFAFPATIITIIAAHFAPKAQRLDRHTMMDKEQFGS
ncbi:hypothetical protein SISNIDRAFT_547191 [Sistotremastrum niveocremeum HHB9708]|uniref:Transmembrane protein n=1 Tax=Sistotremastrum niveocremeum HHB9708 TaxID=1314777 RepID=A0A164YQH6_9AGAM|nr:hypothetical protein SISNIDRAFT_547191 [Sistotremastrum niveocremeum HHB9708]